MNTVKAFAPASVANVCVGFDSLGFAISNHGDDVLVRKSGSPGLSIKCVHKNKTLSKDPKLNTAGFAALKLLESLNLEKEPIEMELFKNLPVGTGLGSSAASAVAGAVAVNEYLGKPYQTAQLLPFVTAAEELIDGSFHADNVAPSLLGSMILIRDNASLDFVKLPIPPGLRTVIVYPKIEVLTSYSRSILKKEVSMEQHISQSANFASFIASMYKSDFDLMKRSLKDIIVEPQRSFLIPGFSQLQEDALNAGALGCSISGAGPSVFCLCNNSIVAENIQELWSQHYQEKGIECECFISDINLEGAFVY